ncbi:MAG: 30S ribosomal protein S27e [Candidatus Aenigmatarchaeota archaeon]|nr:MAG: 30S ribosomal protein S27e [Candidatus Aenigmarchaeota archaeon]
MGVSKMTGKFLKVKCGKCKNEQVIFEKPADDVKCLVCGEVLAKSMGGKARLKAKVLEVVR